MTDGAARSVHRDALITCVVNTLTSLIAGVVTFSILGHVALEQGTTVAHVVTSGPGLVFLTYPEVSTLREKGRGLRGHEKRGSQNSAKMGLK